MSQENVELVMALQRAPDDDFVQLIRDDERWAQLVEDVGPFVQAEAETARPGSPGGKTYIGLDGFRESWLDWLAPYAEYRTEVEEAIDCGDRVLLLQSSSGRLAGKHEGGQARTRRGLHRPRREDRPLRALCRPGRSPRSRGAAGISHTCTCGLWPWPSRRPRLTSRIL
jgi:hypothetical protein